MFRFLWRENANIAISRHYKRFDVYEEAEANKAAGKYDNASIDYQIEFYRREGLTPYSLAKLPITSGTCMIHAYMLCLCLHMLAVCISQNRVYCFMNEFCRCSWRLCHCKGAHSHHKSIYLSMVQWSWSFYSQGSVELFHCERQNKVKS